MGGMLGILAICAVISARERAFGRRQGKLVLLSDARGHAADVPVAGASRASRASRASSSCAVTECARDPNLLPLNDGCAAAHDPRTQLRYLPEPGYFHCQRNRSLTRGRGAAGVWDRDAAAFGRRFAALQNPRDCRRPASSDDGRWHLVKPSVHGMGFDLYVMAMFGVSHVALYGVPLLLGNSRWRFACGGECGRAWSCYLAPLGNCTLEAVARGNASNLARVVAGHGGVTAADACGERGRPRRGALDVARGRCECRAGHAPQVGAVGSAGCMPLASFEEGLATAMRQRFERNREVAFTGEQNDQVRAWRAWPASRAWPA